MVLYREVVSWRCQLAVGVDYGAADTGSIKPRASVVVVAVVVIDIVAVFVVALLLIALIMIVALMMMMIVVNIRQAGASRRIVPLTKKRCAQSLAEEPLTFSPDPRCCPPSTASKVSVVAAVATGAVCRLRLWSQRELVGRRDGREGGA